MFNKRHIVRTIAATVSILALSFTGSLRFRPVHRIQFHRFGRHHPADVQAGQADHRHRDSRPTSRGL